MRAWLSGRVAVFFAGLLMGLLVFRFCCKDYYDKSGMLVVQFEAGVNGGDLARHLVLQGGVEESQQGMLQYVFEENRSRVVVGYHLGPGDDFLSMTEAVVGNLKSAGVENKIRKIQVIPHE